MCNITEETYQEMKELVGQYENKHPANNIEQPYIKIATVRVEHKYNPNYGDDRICKCGCKYYRHFDTYDEMYACGCKYCQGCDTFQEEGEK